MTIRDADSRATPKTKSAGAKLPRPKKSGPVKAAAPQPVTDSTSMTDGSTVTADAPPANDVLEHLETDASAPVSENAPDSDAHSPDERVAEPTEDGDDGHSAPPSAAGPTLAVKKKKKIASKKRPKTLGGPRSAAEPEQATTTTPSSETISASEPSTEKPASSSLPVESVGSVESVESVESVDKPSTKSASAKKPTANKGQSKKGQSIAKGPKSKKLPASKTPNTDFSATKIPAEAPKKSAGTKDIANGADDPPATPTPTVKDIEATKPSSTNAPQAESSSKAPFLARLFTKKPPAPRPPKTTASEQPSAVTKPAVPSVTEPAAPAVTKPPVTKATAPAVTKPPVTKPTAPASTKPVAPAFTKPAAPAFTKPAVTKQPPVRPAKKAPAAGFQPGPAASTIVGPDVDPDHTDPSTALPEPTSSHPGPTGVRAGARTAAREWIVSRLPSVLWLVPALAVSAVITSFNMVNAPVRTVDESVYTAYAWALNTSGEVARFAPWVDHPPLGWMQIAGYTGATNAFQRWDLAVLAGREAMIFFTLVSVLLVFLLARRLRLTRPLAAVAAVIFAVAPLSVEVHRTVSLDTVATPWLLLAFLLAMSRRRQLAAFIASASVFGIAVLTKESFLLALPILAWVMVRSSRPSSRWFTLTAAAVTLQVIGGLYLLLAANQNRLGGAGTTLSDGTLFTVGERVASGIPFAPIVSPALNGFWQTDAALLAVSVVTSVFGLFIARTRPFAVFTLAIAALLFLPQGWLPAGLVVMALPFAALVIAGVVDAAIVVVRRRGVRRSVGPVVALAAVGVGAAVAVPLWAIQLSGLLAGVPADPVRSAQAWLVDNADPGEVLVVDGTMRVDLLRAGWDPADVGVYTAVESASAPAADLPDGWQDADYIVTSAASQGGEGFPQLAEALERTAVLASYGTGADAVEIRLVEPGAPQAAPVQDQSQALRIELGAQLGQNTSLVMSDSDRALLTDGRVDARIIVVLGALAASGDVVVVGFPEVDGEQGLAIRQVAISSVADDTLAVDGTLTPDAESLVGRLTGPYAPDAASADGDTLLLRYPIQTGQSPE